MELFDFWCFQHLRPGEIICGLLFLADLNSLSASSCLRSAWTTWTRLWNTQFVTDRGPALILRLNLDTMSTTIIRTTTPILWSSIRGSRSPPAPSTRDRAALQLPSTGREATAAVTSGMGGCTGPLGVKQCTEPQERVSTISSTITILIIMSSNSISRRTAATIIIHTSTKPRAYKTEHCPLIITGAAAAAAAGPMRVRRAPETRIMVLRRALPTPFTPSISWKSLWPPPTIINHPSPARPPPSAPATGPWPGPTAGLRAPWPGHSTRSSSAGVWTQRPTWAFHTGEGTGSYRCPRTERGGMRRASRPGRGRPSTGWRLRGTRLKQVREGDNWPVKVGFKALLKKPGLLLVTRWDYSEMEGFHRPLLQSSQWLSWEILHKTHRINSLCKDCPIWNERL